MTPERNLRIAVKKPWAAYALVAVSTLVFFTSNEASETGNNFNQRLLDFGAVSPVLVWKGEIWRLFTAIFLHGNFFHYDLSLVQLLFILIQKLFS